MKKLWEIWSTPTVKLERVLCNSIYQWRFFWINLKIQDILTLKQTEQVPECNVQHFIRPITSTNSPTLNSYDHGTVRQTLYLPFYKCKSS